MPKTRTIMTLSLTALAGCVAPIPSGYDGNSRQNLPESTPSFIRSAETTREEVILRLGEPDSAALNDSWISYGSAYCSGGVLFIVGAPNGVIGAGSMGMRYSRLIVPFDAGGFVSQPIFETKSCTEYVGFANDKGGASTPCLDIWGSDIPDKYTLHQIRP